MSDKMKEQIEKKKAIEKKNDKKYLIIMLVLFVLCGVGGYFFGMLMGKLKKSGALSFEISDALIGNLAFVMLAVFVAINVILAVIAVVCISKAKKELKLWDGEDEEVAEKIEGRVSIPLCLSSIVMIINMFLFSVCVNLDINSNFSEKKEDIMMIANVIIFVLSFVVVIVVQKKAIDFTKEMNPEKKGSIFDAKFSQKWEESCDEAQKLQIYKAGSAGFKAMGSACMTLWLVCLVADLFANTGLFPCFIVFVIWLTGNVSYLVGAAKAEKDKN